ncbi:helix-turn-helix domain-containing protein [Chitinophaga oryziterrae]|uniref:Helix-turn-helix domain-containing protein n=1 Tax=Chitinophaga oryziterrae TaxID=1031224 RepID=A0A6N8J3C2_9BACT|nr:AraC family transcriptional regulator [Chitinophaga oryziterrae]MVT39523.1 helix-turn-helix domain-containing protein [Chitinophaga oryziterrae]
MTKPEIEPYHKFYLYRRIVQAKLFIDRHYAQPIDLHQIADEAYFSKFHFTRLFKQAYGKTPHYYLTQVRLDQAKRLLADGEPVTQVCFSVGFDSSTSFAALFKKHAGMAPSVYQAKQLQRKALFNHNPLHAVPNCFAETYGWKNSNIR